MSDKIHWTPVQYRTASNAVYADVRGLGRVKVERAFKYSKYFHIHINGKYNCQVKGMDAAQRRAEEIIMAQVAEILAREAKREQAIHCAD